MDSTNTELILIRISGLDRPGLTASITEILSRYEVDIMISDRQISIVAIAGHSFQMP